MGCIVEKAMNLAGLVYSDRMGALASRNELSFIDLKTHFIIIVMPET